MSNIRWWLLGLVQASALVGSLFLAKKLVRANSPDSDWPMAGQNLRGMRNQPITSINSSNVASLTTAWVFTTGGSVSATPVIAGDDVYFRIGRGICTP
jgi:glucose dehydrogenase